MYAMVTRRRMNQARTQETRERAASEFWPKLQQAPGFVSLTLIQGDEGIVTAVILFESKQHVDDFRGEAESWQHTLDELGHQIDTQEGGEVVQHLTASA